MPNLVKKGTIYRHPILRVTPQLPVSYVTDDGTVRYVGQFQPLQISIIETFTDDDLLEYYRKTIGAFRPIPQHEHDIKKFKGGLVYLCDRYGLDAVLFGIDAAYEVVNLGGIEPPLHPLELQDYICRYAFENLERKKAIDEAMNVMEYIKEG